MDSTIQQPDKKTIRWLMLSIGLQWLSLIFIAAAMLLNSWRMWPFPVAWKTTDWSFDRSEITTATINGNGEPWFIVERTFENRAYQLRHVTKEGTASWDLPFLTFEDARFTAILKDGNNNPWLILGKRLARWDGKQWVFIPMPLDADIKSFGSPSVLIKDSIVWGIDSATKQGRIIQLGINQEPIQAREILLPAGLDPQQYKFDCIISINTGLLAVLSNDEHVMFYQYQNDEWQKITMFTKEQVSNLFVNDVTVDSQGQIWVLLYSWIKGKHVGRYDPKENAWTWLDMEQPDVNIKYIEYGHIAVDKFSRVWLSAKQYGTKGTIFSSSTFDGYTLGVYEESPDGKLVKIQQFTTKDSNLETSPLAKIIIGSDGKAWTWNRQLVWMDSSQPELPSPLPGWFVTLTDHTATISLVVVSLFMTSMVLVIQVVLKRKRQSLPKR